MEKFSKEKLEELIKLVLNYSPKPPSIIVPNRLLEQEIAEHPERFSVSNDEDRTTTWCGYVVYTYGDRYEST
jgi:hypothetical protein